MKEAAKIILSGEHSRRRGYLTNVIVSLNGLAVTASLAICGFFIRWDLLYGKTQDHKLFAIQLACASGLSSIFLGLWRFYARVLDTSIISLYPAIYLCELEIIPNEISSIKPPNDVTRLTKGDISKGIDWKEVRNKDFGGRGHTVIDWIVVIFISVFSAISVSVAYKLGIVGLALGGWPHLIGWLLSGNIVGVFLVLGGWWRWKKKVVMWPVPKTDQTSQKEPSAG
jgi:hypothetical protein